MLGTGSIELDDSVLEERLASLQGDPRMEAVLKRSAGSKDSKSRDARLAPGEEEGGPCSSLAALLESANLAEFAAPLRHAFGAEDVEDLSFLDEDDYAEVNMKKVQVRKAQRAVNRCLDVGGRVEI